MTSTEERPNFIESVSYDERSDETSEELKKRVLDSAGIENCVFETVDPAVFEWYIKNFGPNVNLFVDNSQIVELECMRSGLWGKKSSWGRTGPTAREERVRLLTTYPPRRRSMRRRSADA